ncbi:Protein-glutamine gamma-glutamyltransferase [Rubripirellula tenax]|uniref:Protein-glutamine gamma-glutamyltransferase n=1 Tax=Rubripirellula tenax TaxID=2528015 RepID=A0A5C6FG04_9BACT|nr:transglutaminase domain-containing protein [Rubripirellula tenax]TWU60461.1 Protein-glutamine gamma-glutamyltransferase [Rubripirellula tenax]
MTEQAKFERAKLLLGALLVAEMMFLASTFSGLSVIGPLTLLAVAVVAARHFFGTSGSAVVLKRSAVPRSIKWMLQFAFVLAVMGLTFTWRVSGRMGVGANVISLGVDVVAHVAFFISLVVWVSRPERGHVSLLPLGLTMMMLCVAAGGVSQSLAAQTTVGLVSCVGFCAASQIILAAKQGRATKPLSYVNADHEKSAWLGPICAVLALSVLMMVTSAVASVTESMLPGIQDDLKHQLQASLDVIGEQSYVGGTRYVSGSRLGSVREHLTIDPQGLALRVFANSPPGYLRGTVFDVYRSSRWYSSSRGNRDGDNPDVAEGDFVLEPSGVAATSTKSTLRRKLNRFVLRPEVANSPSVKRAVTLEIYADPTKGRTVFLPLTTSWIEAASQEIIVSRSIAIKVGVDVSLPCVAGVSDRLAAQTIAPGQRRALEDIPRGLTDLVATITDEVCEGATTSRQKSEAISNYFQKNFRYGLNKTKAPSRVDPLAYFLQTRHVAHCEYFASATVLMLRHAGIPSRYVTGYVADELGESEPDLWLARNRDAHAWAEAFDEESGQWFAVESTPGRVYQTIAADASDNGDIFDGSSDLVTAVSDNEGWLSRIAGYLFAMRVTDSLLFLFRIAQLPLVCGLAYIWWTKFWKPSRAGINFLDQQCRRRLEQVDRRLKKLSLVRRPTETLYQFADRVQQHATELQPALSLSRHETMNLAASWYRTYADARYQGKLPPEFESV